MTKIQASAELLVKQKLSVGMKLTYVQGQSGRADGDSEGGGDGDQGGGDTAVGAHLRSAKSGRSAINPTQKIQHCTTRGPRMIVLSCRRLRRLLQPSGARSDRLKQRVGRIVHRVRPVLPWPAVLDTVGQADHVAILVEDQIYKARSSAHTCGVGRGTRSGKMVAVKEPREQQAKG